MNLDANSTFRVCTEQEEEIFKNHIPEFYGDKWIKKNQIFDENSIVLWDIWKYTNHHYTGSWLSPSQKLFNSIPFLAKFYRGIKNIIRHN